MGCVAGSDAIQSIPVPCSWFNDITSPTFTSQVFIDTLTAASHGILPYLADSDFRSEQLSTILKCMQHTQIHILSITMHLMGWICLAVQLPLISVTLAQLGVSLTKIVPSYFLLYTCIFVFLLGAFAIPKCYFPLQVKNKPQWPLQISVFILGLGVVTNMYIYSYKPDEVKIKAE